MTVSKRVGQRGGVTIPQQLRHEAGILPGAPVDIEASDDGIVIRKHVPTCSLCGSVEHVIKFKGLEICGLCAAEAADAACENEGG